jgi:hypothetical protein
MISEIPALFQWRRQTMNESGPRLPAVLRLLQHDDGRLLFLN